MTCERGLDLPSREPSRYAASLERDAGATAAADGFDGKGIEAVAGEQRRTGRDWPGRAPIGAVEERRFSPRLQVSGGLRRFLDDTQSRGFRGSEKRREGVGRKSGRTDQIGSSVICVY